MIYKKVNVLRRYVKSSLAIEKEEDDQETYREIYEGAEFSGANVWILGFAMIIACIGLNNDSISAIIGAMLISPLMGPIIAYAFALSVGDVSLKRKAIRNWIWMTVISLLASCIYFTFTPIESNTVALSSFTRASLFDILIAFFGGLAGFVGILKRDGVKVLAGVSVATACMPPLCTAGFGLAHLDWKIAMGGFYFYFINCLFIGLATFMLSRFYGMHLRFKIDAKMSNWQIWIWRGLIICMLIPSIYIFYDKWKKENNGDREVKPEVQKILELEHKLSALEMRLDSISKYHFTLKQNP